MTPATAIPPQLGTAQQLSGEKYTAQAISSATPLEKTRVQPYHASICRLIAAEYRGRAHANTLACRPEAVDTETARSEAFDWLAARLRDAARGVPAIIRAPDLELVRWHQLMSLRAGVHSTARHQQQKREHAALMELLTAALAGDVEGLTAAVPRA